MSDRLFSQNWRQTRSTKHTRWRSKILCPLFECRQSCGLPPHLLLGLHHLDIFPGHRFGLGFGCGSIVCFLRFSGHSGFRCWGTLDFYSLGARTLGHLSRFLESLVATDSCMEFCWALRGVGGSRRALRSPGLHSLYLLPVLGESYLSSRECRHCRSCSWAHSVCPARTRICPG